MTTLRVTSWDELTLANIERVEKTVSRKKSQFCCFEIKIIDFICDNQKKYSETIKIIKILNWSFCIDLQETRSFFEICVYYHIWIKDFVIIAIFIYVLFKKEIEFY